MRCQSAHYVGRMPSAPTPDPALEALAATLDASSDYRVVRRLRSPARYAIGEPVGELKQGLLLDLETTGLDTARDLIIEFGAVPFLFDSAGQVFDVLAPISYFEDPGRPIPPEVQSLTGITDDMVRGQRIDDARVEAVVNASVLVVAHNAGFDRRVAERRFPIFASKHWGCSRDDVPWSAGFGISSHKLDYLLYETCRVFHDGHRAADDCLATLHLLAHPKDAAGKTPMAHLLESARRKTSRVFARKSPFETKDALKGRGYRWNDAQKTWFIDKTATDLDAELQWLRENVYGGTAAPPAEVVTFTAKERYSDRG